MGNEFFPSMSTRPDFPAFHGAHPVLGRDGTLTKIQTANPAAGHVFAKTGTHDSYDALNKKLMITGKGLTVALTLPRGNIGFLPPSSIWSKSPPTIPRPSIKSLARLWAESPPPRTTHLLHNRKNRRDAERARRHFR
jgi:hypothetical protein